MGGGIERRGTSLGLGSPFTPSHRTFQIDQDEDGKTVKRPKGNHTVGKLTLPTYLPYVP